VYKWDHHLRHRNGVFIMIGRSGLRIGSGLKHRNIRRQEVRHFIPDQGCAYHDFKDCRIVSDGFAVEFTYPNGVEYVVPSSYIDRWYATPDQILKDGKWVGPKNDSAAEFMNWQASWHQEHRDPMASQRGEIRTVRLRRLTWLHKHGVFLLVRIYLSNNKSHIVHGDHVLGYCEPNFEYFVGYTAENAHHNFQIYKRFRDKITSTFVGQAFENKAFGRFLSVELDDQQDCATFTVACREQYRVPIQLLRLAERISTCGLTEETPSVLKKALVDDRNVIVKARKVTLSKDRKRAKVLLEDASKVEFDTLGILAIADRRYSHYFGQQGGNEEKLGDIHNRYKLR